MADAVLGLVVHHHGRIRVLQYGVPTERMEVSKKKKNLRSRGNDTETSHADFSARFNENRIAWLRRRGNVGTSHAGFDKSGPTSSPTQSEFLCARHTFNVSQKIEVLSIRSITRFQKKYLQANVTSSVSSLGGSNMCMAPALWRDVLHGWCRCCVHRKRCAGAAKLAVAGERTPRRAHVQRAPPQLERQKVTAGAGERYSTTGACAVLLKGCSVLG